MSTGRVDVGQQALQAIFSVFLGLILTAFVGVGTYTFMPSPSEERQTQLTALYDEQSAIQGCERLEGCVGDDELTAAQKQRLKTINTKIRELNQLSQSESRGWAQRTSVVLISLATLLMVISLAIPGAVVISNGVLLGGLFTMLYAVGWGIASGNSLGRFLVLSAALAISLSLGYVRFVRRAEPGSNKSAPVPTTDAATESADPAASGELAELAARVGALENSLSAAAAALAAAAGPTEDRSRQ